LDAEAIAEAVQRPTMKFVNQDYRTARLAGGLSSAMVAAIRTGDAFSKGRDFGAWLGLVP
jgi:transposase